MRRVVRVAVLLLALGVQTFGQTAPPVAYVVTFPAPEHHWLQVEVTFPSLGSAPLRARMSRSSPGRYSVHEFAKNVFWTEAYDGSNRRLTITRPDTDEWNIAGHDGTVRLVYRIFGDHADGTYMGVDTTHAHLNIPATFMWGVGFDMRPIRIRFVPPAGSSWKVGTQLFPGASPFEFTAPNLQYFMDSPIEFSNFLVSTFRIARAGRASAEFRLVTHSEASQAEVDELSKLVERVVREHVAVFGELPEFETGRYTFLLDYVPWVRDDAMEHRNSTSISTPGLSLRSPQDRARALSEISHEFFHVWNVERIRPADLEPFDFTRQNVTCCLWLAEGFTQYYGDLLLLRAGLSRQPPVGYAIAAVNGPGRQVRSAVEMSQYAPFADESLSNDATDQNRTFVSYYTYGAALALGLDLALRDLSANRLSLDAFMRVLWDVHGKPVDSRPGFVAKPYSLQDLRARLAELTGNRAFADEFFDKYIEGREVMDYARLLALAGYELRPTAPARGWIGNATVDETAAGLLVGGTDARWLVPFGTPLYDAGVDAGDVILTIDQRPATMTAWAAIGDKRPGDRVTLSVRRRDGKTVTTTATVQADPQVAVMAVESTGGSLTVAQRAFRQSWLGTKVN